MGRKLKLYSEECEAVREMGPGQVIKFRAKHPWGLHRRIDRELRKWLLREYYKMKVGHDFVEVRKENTAYEFRYD